MVRPTLVVLAAGLATRYGRLKQLDPVGPSGEALMDYGVFDAVQAGFGSVVFVVRKETEATFREHATRAYGDALPVSFAVQALGDLPTGVALPPGRTKPWGTAHAALAAAAHVTGPFVAVNADDWYGPSALAALADHFRGPSATTPDFAMVGYLLRDTLSCFGGVSRAVCEHDDDDFLVSMVEVKHIEDRGHQITGVTDAGTEVTLTGAETVSMNVWGFTPRVFPLLRNLFGRFLLERGRSDHGAEFLLSTAVNDLVSGGDARLKILASRERWFGMTFPEDHTQVVAALAALVDAGRYPSSLSTWFRQHI